MNDAELVPVPPDVVTAMGPLEAPIETVVVIWLYEVTLRRGG